MEENHADLIEKRRRRCIPGRCIPPVSVKVFGAEHAGFLRGLMVHRIEKTAFTGLGHGRRCQVQTRERQCLGEVCLTLLGRDPPCADLDDDRA